jgi:hypothetical protein
MVEVELAANGAVVLDFAGSPVVSRKWFTWGCQKLLQLVLDSAIYRIQARYNN